MSEKRDREAMSGTTPGSPREEALRAILQVRGSMTTPRIDVDSWETIVDIAWDSRTIEGDRREALRQLRNVLLKAARTAEANDATS